MNLLRPVQRFRMWRPLPLPVPQTLVIVCVALDLFVYFGALIAPDAVGATICSTRKLTAVAAPLFPTQWFDYVAAACAESRGEPATSILAFMIKVSLLILALLVGAVQMAVLPGSGVDPGAEAVRSPTRDHVKGVIAIVVFASGMLFTLLYEINKPPGMFSTSLSSKFVFEDFGLIITTFFWITMAIGTSISVIKELGRKYLNK